MAQFRSTYYKESVPGSPKGARTRGGSWCVRILDIYGEGMTEGVSAETLDRAAKDFVGYADVQAFGGVSYVHRVTPAPHPTIPKMFCVGITDYEGLGPQGKELGNDPGNDLAIYRIWRCTLRYESLPFSILDDDQMLAAGFVDAVDEIPVEMPGTRYCSYHSVNGGRFFSHPHGIMYTYAAGDVAPQPMLEGTPFWLSESTVTITNYDVPAEAVPSSAIQRIKGRINDAPVGPFATNTLLFLSEAITPDTDIFGNHTYNLQYQCKYSPNVSRNGTNTPRGHNWIPRRVASTSGDPAAPDYIDFVLAGTVLSGYNVLAAGANSIYEEDDFADLFRPDH